MGRNTGWLAAASVLAKSREDDPPHLICLPEVPFNSELFLNNVSEKYRDLGFLYIVASEGLIDEKEAILLPRRLGILSGMYDWEGLRMH